MSRRSGFKKRFKDGDAGLAGGANNATRTFSSGEVYEGGGGGSYFADSVPVAYWNMEDGTGTTVSDVSSAGNNLDGSFLSTQFTDETTKELWDTTTKVRGSNSIFVDEGYKECVIVNDDPNLDFGAGDSFSISCWAKRSGIAGSVGGGLVVKAAANAINGDTAFEGYAFWLLGDSYNQPQFLLYRNDSPAASLRINGGYISDTNWHHLVVTYNGNADLSGVKMYLDNTSLSLTLLNDTLDPTNDILTSTPLTIGSFLDTDVTVYDKRTLPFDGNIDEVAIWNKVLSSEEVDALYNEGNGNDLTNGIPSA